MKSNLTLLLAASLIVTATANAGNPNLVVHEWGTFTSVQGSDGEQLAWFADQASELPQFVYDWSKPGLNRPGPMRYHASKIGMLARQRMETPVIYFYSDEKLTADVTVKFPDGLITEWFPQAALIGPAVSHEDLEAGIVRNRFASYDSLISWRGVDVFPAKQNPELAARMPVDERGRHYFAARETDSAFLSVNNLAKTGNTEEFDKVLFYRGAGNFFAPLKVTVGKDGAVNVANTSKETLSDLFLLQLRGNSGQLTHLARLDGGARDTVGKLNEGNSTQTLSADKLRGELSRQMESALVAAGLFPREAAAMVRTWSDSWFSEQGVRVLYLLPRSWTDGVLPIEIAPQPRELVRVMVGRAEIIPPNTVRTIAGELQPSANAWPVSVARLGRFQNAAMQLVSRYVEQQKEQAHNPVAAAGQR